MNKTKKKNIGTALMLAGLLLLVSAFLLLIYNLWDNSRAGQASAEVLEKLEEEIPGQTDYTEDEAEDLPLYMLEPDIEMPAVEIDGNRYIGYIEIPDIGISLPVMEKWDYDKLKLSPCRYSGTAYKDNFVIAAHNYDEHFGRLKNLSVGSSIIFTDMDGNVFNYEVAEIETLQPTAIEEMKSSGWALSLFTCTLGGEFRVTVRCDRA